MSAFNPLIIDENVDFSIMNNVNIDIYSAFKTSFYWCLNCQCLNRHGINFEKIGELIIISQYFYHHTLIVNN